MSKDKTLFHGIYLYETKEEKLIAKLRVINQNNSPSLLVLEEPQKEFHRHHYFDKETKKIKGHIKNEKIGERKEIKETFKDFRNKRVGMMLNEK